MALFAERAHGNVTRLELLGVGVSAREIEHRLRTGSLIAKYRGVYRVGHAAPSLEADYMAAVKACGEGAVLSGFAAAHLYGLTKGEAPPPEVTTPWDRRVKRIRVHRARAGLDLRDVTHWRGIPITTIPRTLVDIASRLPEHELARVYHEAAVRFRVRPERVEAVLERRPNSAGAGELRRVMWGDTQLMLSKLEEGFFELLEEAKLPLPETNRPAGAHYVDCRWPRYGVTVELDSYRYHHTRKAWEKDILRARAARKRGDEFERYSWGDVFERRADTAAEVRALLYEM